MSSESGKSLRVLIADDTATDRKILQKIIQNQGHIPITAVDGAEAIALFQAQRPDIVLLDALMPNVDGFEAARFIKANSGDDFIPVIFLTSLQEADELAKCLEVGGDDFLTKPYNQIILRAKLNAFQRMREMHVILQQQRDQIAANNQRLIHEQEVAKRTFDKIAHEGALHVKNIQYNMSPMAVFNGDVLLAAIRPNGNLTVLLGDFTGHGLPAAIGAMPLSQTFYSMVAKGFSLKEIIVELNGKLKEILPIGVFCCASMIDMDFRTKTLEIWTGGMPDSYIYRAQSQSIIPIPSRHVALGIKSVEQFSANTDTYPMMNGDRIFLWSDGIMEAQNPEGEMFGEDRLREVFAKNTVGQNLFAEINSALEGFIGSAERADDISIAEIEMIDFHSFEEIAPRNAYDMNIKPMDWGFAYEVRSLSLRESDPLPQLQKMLIELPSLRPRSAKLFNVFTVLSELYSNALEHGVLGLNSHLKTTSEGFTEYYELRTSRLNQLTDGYIRFEFDCRMNHEGMILKVRVIDSGAGFDHRSHLANAAGKASYSGRGLMLLNNYCSSVEYFNQGNEVQVVFDWRTHMESHCDKED